MDNKKKNKKITAEEFQNLVLENLKNINIKLDEHTQILRALEHSAEINKAEHDNMGNDIDHIKGDVETIKREMSTIEIVTSSNYADIAKLKAVK
jgi:hypothetical protein